MNKAVATAVIAMSVIGVARADDVQVNGYYRSSGQYVAPYSRSSPNGSPFDNRSADPNITNAQNDKSNVYIPPNTAPRNAWMYDNRPCAHSADPRRGEILGQNNCVDQ